MSELEDGARDMALKEAARAMAEQLTEDPDRRVLIQQGFEIAWGADRLPKRSSRPHTLRLSPVADPGDTQARAFLVFDFHYLAYPCSFLVWNPDKTLDLMRAADLRIIQLTGSLAVEFWNWFTFNAPLPEFADFRADPPNPKRSPVEPPRC